MGQLQFITANPAIEAFDRRVDIREQQDLRQLEMEGRQLALDEARAMSPYNIASARDTSRLRTVQADVAEKTAPYDVQSAQTTAEQGAFNLQQDRTLAPYEQRKAAAGATEAEVGAEFARPQAQAQLAATQAGTAATRAASSRADAAILARNEEQFFSMAVDDPDGAILWGRRNGVEITPDMETWVRDKKKMARIRGMIEGVNERMPGDANILARDKEYERLFGKYFAPQEAPGDSRFGGAEVMPEMPDESSLYADMYGGDATTPVQPAARGSGSGSTVFDRKFAMWKDVYVAQGLDEQTATQMALEIASGIKQYSDTQLMLEANKAARGEVSGTFGTAEDKTARVQQRTKEIYEQLRQTQAADVGLAPAAPAAPQQTMKGPDGNDYPVISDQAAYDALPAGSGYYDAIAKKFKRKAG